MLRFRARISLTLVKAGMIERSGTPSRVKAPGLYLGATLTAWLAEVGWSPWSEFGEDLALQLHPQRRDNRPNLTIHPDPNGVSRLKPSGRTGEPGRFCTLAREGTENRAGDAAAQTIGRAYGAELTPLSSQLWSCRCRPPASRSKVAA